MNLCRSGLMVFIHPERVPRSPIVVHYGEAPPRSGFVQLDAAGNAGIALRFHFHVWGPASQS